MGHKTLFCDDATSLGYYNCGLLASHHVPGLGVWFPDSHALLPG